MFSGAPPRAFCGEEFVHRGEGGGADVVFNTFRVGHGVRARHTEQLEKGDDCLVAVFGPRREGASGRSEEDRAVRQGFDQPLPLEALDCADDRDVGDPERPGDVGARASPCSAMRSAIAST